MLGKVNFCSFGFEVRANELWLLDRKHMSSYCYASSCYFLRLEIKWDREDARIDSDLVYLHHQSLHNIFSRLIKIFIPLTYWLVLVHLMLQRVPEVQPESLDRVERCEEIEVVANHFENILLKVKEFSP